jgi:hypothetical protein
VCRVKMIGAPTTIKKLIPRPIAEVSGTRRKSSGNGSRTHTPTVNVLKIFQIALISFPGATIKAATMPKAQSTSNM